MKKSWKIILIVSLVGNVTIAYVAYKAWEYRSHINFFLDKYLQVAEEIGQRHVYERANETLRADSTVSGRVVFLGTQVTQNWDLERYFHDYEAINRGVEGQRVAGFLLRFRPDVIALAPQSVVIEISSYNFRPNSSVREIQEYVASLADLARANDIRPLLSTVIPPRADFVVFEHEDYAVKDSVALFNRWLLSFADSNRIHCLDFFQSVADKGGSLRPELSTSRVDLNDEGYQLISEVTRYALREINNQLE